MKALSLTPRFSEVALHRTTFRTALAVFEPSRKPLKRLRPQGRLLTSLKRGVNERGRVAFAPALGWLFTVVMGVTNLLPPPIQAQTNSPSTLPANRYLIVVETSHAMQRRSAGAFRAVHDMLGSRMRGQLHLGDTIGVWTYNEKLYTGQLALQEWSEGERAAIDDKVLNFLGKQKFEKQGRFDAVLPALLQVVKNSQFITVILISEGNQDFHGTPYDQQINQSYKAWSTQQQDAHMPFLTVLRARRGQFTNFSVTSAPWAIDMPPLPSDLLTPRAPPSLPVVSTPKTAPPSTVPPLIISGKKSQPAPTVSPTTNSSTGAQVSAPAIGSNAASQLTQRIAEPPPTASTITPTSGVTPSPATINPPAQPAPVESVRLDQATSDNRKASSGAPQDRVVAQPTESPDSTKKSDSSTAVPSESRAESPASAKGVSPSASTQQATVTESDSAVRPRPELATTPGAPIPSTTKVIAIILFGACCAAGFVFWLWKRRARPVGHVSLITRSLDREKD
ncbi:MAG TPA: hypothetical protein VL361_02875 [Candidatus Limnocylindrales bacterium]|nr:hypothetical protein [Candidatus Limnocylindrales bacterium]